VPLALARLRGADDDIELVDRRRLRALAASADVPTTRPSAFRSPAKLWSYPGRMPRSSNDSSIPGRDG